LGSLAANVAMALGFHSRISVPLCFLANVLQNLPLSAAHQVMRGVPFGLMWAETGAVWSLDACWRRGSAPTVQV
jgi:hypothetical protein